MNLQKTLKSLSMAGIAAAAMAVGTAQASIMTFYESFSGTNVSGSLILDGASNGDGTFNIVSGTGTETVNGVTDALTLIGNPNAPGYSSVAAIPGYVWNYDDRFTPGADPLLDSYGLMFSSSDGLEVNIWGTAPGSYIYGASNGTAFLFGLGGAPVTFGATVPEPASLALLGLGLLGLAVSHRRAGKNTSA